jgi:hypothetical protein
MAGIALSLAFPTIARVHGDVPMKIGSLESRQAKGAA